MTVFFNVDDTVYSRTNAFVEIASTFDRPAPLKEGVGEEESLV